MINTTVKTSDGLSRMVRAKVFDDVLRVYDVMGDISDRDSLLEMAQILAVIYGVQRVEINA